jgi:gliding motility-associated-like protein
MRFILLFLTCCCCQVSLSQNCTFDFSNEGWAADGDAVNSAAVWQNSGGNPGGYIRTVDGSTGGTWYFVGGNKFNGIKCDAYGRFLRYDQFASNNSNPSANRPDVEIKGNGITLVFDNPVLPGASWTHYDILLREDAGWRLNTLNGATPTAAEFKKALANVTSLRIRGEFYSFADDFGGLDNVVLESEFTFTFDLDGDDSSGATGGNFQTTPSCIPVGNIVDADLVLSTEARIDSILVRIVNGSVLERLQLSFPAGNILVLQPSSGVLRLINNGNASPADFIALLKLIQYLDTSPDLISGTRLVQIQVFTDCAAVGEMHRAFLPFVAQPYAGLNGDTLLCHGSGPMDLRTVLRDDPDFNGFWEPALHSGSNIFNPSIDSAGTYRYIVPQAEPCLGDTAEVKVIIHYPFRLRPDTTICYDKTLYIEAPRGLVDWTWSDGSKKLNLPVTEAGTYTLYGETGHCSFSDSVAVSFYTCIECPPYAPNVFSPNDDGLNDEWHIFLHCRWASYNLEVYDRWGSLVFAADNPESTWDGRIQGKDAETGVYVWRMKWTGELFGVPKTWTFEGDLTLIK